MHICCCCTICLETFESDSVLMHLKCGHIFHQDCLKQWLKESKTCPQCRKKGFKPTRVYPNFITISKDDVTKQRIQREKDECSSKLAKKDADLALMEASMKITAAYNNKVMSDLRNENRILEERVNELLLQNCAIVENANKLAMELKNVLCDRSGSTKLIECFQRVNSELQTQLDDLEVENNRLKDQIRTAEAKSAIKRKVATQELFYKRMKKFGVDSVDLVDDGSVTGNNDCCIVAN